MRNRIRKNSKIIAFAKLLALLNKHKVRAEESSILDDMYSAEVVIRHYHLKSYYNLITNERYGTYAETDRKRYEDNEEFTIDMGANYTLHTAYVVNNAYG